MAATQVGWRSFLSVFGFPMNFLKNTFTLVIGNPIISREMKVRMRFARAFWLQGAYLFFLIIIVLLAYQGIIAQSPLQHPAQLQMRLQKFYYVLLYSLVAIIVLIAPALTASAISFEREEANFGFASDCTFETYANSLWQVSRFFRFPDAPTR